MAKTARAAPWAHALFKYVCDGETVLAAPWTQAYALFKYVRDAEKVLTAPWTQVYAPFMHVRDAENKQSSKRASKQVAEQ
eukprot:8201519-Lingulodinium_polyedra.AAC.1